MDGDATAKRITAELVDGEREALYWHKVPEKVRRGAVRKAIALALTATSASGTGDGDGDGDAEMAGGDAGEEDAKKQGKRPRKRRRKA